MIPFGYNLIMPDGKNLIIILPDSLINKIAAGEVIDRPASVVRELIDNSIDANATRIDVEVIHGGKRLIRVSDNGTGMNRDDAVMSLERHATSKLRTEDDLFRISTLGFRGEALPAIASVSKMVITTSSGDEQIGTRIEVAGGEKKRVSAAPPLRGTTVEVRDIFYNTPARRKFLKGVSTELSHIIEIITQRAFAYPDISFSLMHNNNKILDVISTPNIRERFLQLYGEEFVSEFMEIRNERGGINIKGFVSTPESLRERRSHQSVFVNRRAVRNHIVNHAIYNGYGEFLQRGKHPAFFIFIEIEPEMIDVNVHPAKMEVRFESPQEIHQCVEGAVHAALHPERVEEYYKEPLSEDRLTVREDMVSPLSYIQRGFFTDGVASAPQRYLRIGDVFIASVSDKGLMIIDQHAAHERVLYERFLKKRGLNPEPLFLPFRIELPKREHHIITSHLKLLNEIGLEIEDFGGNDIIVKSVPQELKKADIKNILMDIASGIIEEDPDDREAILKEISARLACHRSVRGGSQLNDEEIVSMLSDLERCSEPERCPHGRPTRVFISLDDLKKMFKR